MQHLLRHYRSTQDDATTAAITTIIHLAAAIMWWFTVSGLGKRANRCYAPAGASSCGGAEDDKAVRKAWYARLKRDYSASPWARDLAYYW